MGEETTPQAVDRRPLIALVLALLALGVVLAAGAVESAATHVNPKWRGDAYAEWWLLRLSVGAGVLALAALVLGLANPSPGPRPRGSWVATVVVAFVLLGGVGMTAVYKMHYRHFHYLARIANCLTNVKNVALAFSMYATDYDGFPPAVGWRTAMDGYVKNLGIYQCPQMPGQRQSYAYNDRLSGISLSALANPDQVVCLFESDRGWNAHGGPELLPDYPRHGPPGGDNYGFADGSARWLVRKNVPGQSGRWLKEPVGMGKTVTWEVKVKEPRRD